MDREGFLAVSDLLNHRYCGRITWFAYVLGIRQRGTVKTEDGRQRHQRWEDRERRRWQEGASVRARSKVVSEEIISERLRLRGRVDAIIAEDGHRAPYEVKATAPPAQAWPGQLLQLAAYALLLEERYERPVEHGYLHYLEGDVVREHPITGEDKESVIDVLTAIREVVEFEAMPERAPASHCRDCVYSKICV